MRLPLAAALVLPLAAQAPVAVPDGATVDAIAALAADVRPSPRQLAWQATGCNAFVHFGMNTFTGREWGDGKESPATFAPTDFDADQWVAAFAAAGMRGVVLTCKHCDGFCLWPSATTTHDVASSPFRAGKGDVVAEVAAACRAQGLQFGVYLSPWDQHDPTFGTPAYHATFLAQLRELCSSYGPLFEVWFDGANCPPDDPTLFDWQAVFAVVRELQPDAAIAITGPDVRWVGNEAGTTRAQEWSVLPLPQPAPGDLAGDRQSWRALWALRARNQEPELGGRAALADAKALCWWPAETDVSIRPGWFWRADEDAQVKPLERLLDFWYGAVGGNAVLLLNVPADARGRIADPDVRALRELGDHLRATFGSDLADRGARKQYPKVGEVVFDAPTTVDTFELREDVAASGQRIEAFRVEALQNGGWRECARGGTVGFRRILRTEPITADGFRYWIEQSRGKPQIARFALHRRPPLLPAPRIARDPAGAVTLRGSGVVRYTLDGSAVTAASPRYTAPLPLPDGGVVRAATFAGDAPTEPAGREAAATFGVASAGFTIVDCSSEDGGAEAAAKAIDGDPRTHWHTRWSGPAPRPPHHLTIGLGRAIDLRGFVYQPRAEGDNGTVAAYELRASRDGATWTQVAAGEFGNIATNRTAQVVRLPEPFAGARFVRFVAVREVKGRAWASCAELSVLAK